MDDIMLASKRSTRVLDQPPTYRYAGTAMEQQTREHLHRLTAWITLTAFAFTLFFQVNKGGPFQEINPFAVDPYDGVGSFAVQGALLVGMLTYGRALRLWTDPTQTVKARLILRGNVLVLFAIGITLVSDAVAILIHPIPASTWGNILKVELAGMSLLALGCALALAIGYRQVPTPPPPRNLTPADGIDDLWTLVRLPVTKAQAILPGPLVEWVEGFESDHLFQRVKWIHPRSHPWRFACVLGLLAGMGLLAAQLQEGLPPNLLIGMLLAGIFISAELSATLLGYAVLGTYLGLRPSSRGNHHV